MSEKIFKNDVIYMKNLIGKAVSIETVNNKKHDGIIYVIDPVSKTVVLLNPEDKSELEFIIHHAIKNLTVVSDVVNESLLLNPRTVKSDPQEVLQTKRRLIKWLKHMHINAEEAEDCIRVEDHLRIESPYDIEHCLCDNTIVLQRIRNIIQLMPEDFK